MCLVCVELNKGMMTRREAIRALSEIVRDADVEHEGVVMQSLVDAEVDERLAELSRHEDDGYQIPPHATTDGDL